MSLNKIERKCEKGSGTLLVTKVPFEVDKSHKMETISFAGVFGVLVGDDKVEFWTCTCLKLRRESLLVGSL